MAKMSEGIYRYRATVTDVYDGDTVTMSVDCGFGIVLAKQKVRLLGIDARELRGDQREDGIKARDALRGKVLGKVVTLETVKDKKGKYGRLLGRIHVHEDGADVDVNTWLVEQGYASWRDY